MSKDSKQSDDGGKDIFRDTAVRFLGNKIRISNALTIETRY